MATRQLRVVALLVALPAFLGFAAACGALIGIQDLGVDPARPGHDGGTPLEAGDGVEPADALSPEDSAPVEASAPPIVLDAATPTRRVFLRSEPTSGHLGGLSGADTLCNSAATNLGTRRWVAFVSGEGMRAIDRLDFRGPFVTVTGTLVLLDKNDIPNKPPLEHLINITETGAPLASNQPFVWTGTDRNGNASPYDCSDWGNGTIGFAGRFDQASNNAWIQTDQQPFAAAFGCGTPAHLYCFEQTN
jgi:hypothetical protein